ncbi:hypothetical protein DH86_00002146 [Scytalidium sp. 3C]|nr:hypothetical protein DH86_00002146 [Scytalidium sp. 3C]
MERVLYVPVEEPTQKPKEASVKPASAIQDDDSMQLDNTKHKVYIYNLDDELSDSDSDDGKLVFLPDIEKHLRQSRIPPSVLANKDGELAGNNMQLVLYKSMDSVLGSMEQDRIRKAIAETRAKARARQEEERQSQILEAQDPVAAIHSKVILCAITPPREFIESTHFSGRLMGPLEARIEMKMPVHQVLKWVALFVRGLPSWLPQEADMREAWAR